MKKLIVMALLALSLSAFAGSSNDMKGFQILLKNAGSLQLTDSFSDETFILSDLLSGWLLSTPTEVSKTITNTCTNQGKCTLLIFLQDADPDGGAFESALNLEYNVDLKNGKMKEGYRLHIAG